MQKLNNYNTPLGNFDIVSLKEEKAIRIVLTGRCNLACEFCIYKKENFNSSEVETEDLVDLNYSNEFLKTLLFFKKEFGYNVIHLTGGEPTICEDIVNICSNLVKNGFKINIVTNLTKINKIEELYEKNLINELTFSYVPSDKKNVKRLESLKDYKTTDELRYQKVLDNVLMLKNKYHSLIKSNIICSGLTDVDKAVEMINWCFDNDIDPRLQRDRSSDRIDESNNTVKNILEKLNMKKDYVEIRVPGATEILRYYNSKNQKICVKVFNKNFRFLEICKQCERVLSCDKSLSSIRLYQKKDGVYLCFCNKFDKEFNTMKLEDFKKSKVANEIKEYKFNKNSYFERFCVEENHQ